MMKNVTRHVGTLRIVKQLRNSKNGNPRFRCYVAGFHFNTKPDCMLSYDIRNLDGKEVVATIGTWRNNATLASIQEAR
jgi:hypothetical protein